MTPDLTPTVTGVGDAESVGSLPAAPAPPRRLMPRLHNILDWDDDDVDDELIARESARVQAQVWVPVVVAFILLGGFLMRLSAADHLSPQIDEAASVMAAKMVTERGLPIFPSDIPYFQGATLSYVLAPFVALGAGDLGDLQTMRIVSVIASVLALYFTYRIGRELSGEAWPGVLAAGMLTLDPISTQWAGHVRMYAPLQAFGTLLVWLYCRAMLGTPTRRLLAGIVVVFWLGVFTHIAIALFWLPMAVVALAIYRRALRDEQRDLSLALVLCAAAPVFLFGINSVLGPSDRAVSKSVPFLSFVGDHLLSVSRILDPNFMSWELLFAGGALVDVLPYVMVLLSGLIAGRYLLGRIDPATGSRERRSVGMLLAFYWFPILAVGFFTNEPQERYVIHAQPLGFVIVALAVRELIVRRSGEASEPIWQRRSYRIGGAVALALVLIHLGSGLNHLSNHTVPDPDYVAAAEYVAARHTEGEPVIVGLTPPVYLALDGSADLIFAAGPWDSDRAERYTRRTGDGEYVDYWGGVPAFVFTDQICQTLLNNPDAWLILDNQRLNADWAFRGDMARVMTGLTYRKYEAPGGAVVLRVAPVPSRNPIAERTCEKAADDVVWQRKQAAGEE